MTQVTKEQAIDLLTTQVENHFDVDELLYLDNQLFEEDPFTEDEAYEDDTLLIERIVDHFAELEPDEIVGVWPLVLPQHHNFRYVVAEEQFHYDDAQAPPAE